MKFDYCGGIIVGFFLGLAAFGLLVVYNNSKQKEDITEYGSKFEAVDTYYECDVIRYTDLIGKSQYLLRCPK